MNRLIGKLRKSLVTGLVLLLSAALVARPVLAAGNACMVSFAVLGGQIISPNGTAFIARGVDVQDPHLSADQPHVLPGGDFAKTNMVRITFAPNAGYRLPTYYDSFVAALTAKKIVVEIGDYNAIGTCFTGANLTTETNWFASLAQHFINNPYVWFSTLNEPQDTPAGCVSAEQLAVYNAIRGTGSTAMIGLELIGGQVKNGLIAADYTGMTNVHWDVHYYNTASGYDNTCNFSGSSFSTSQTQNNAAVLNLISCAQALSTDLDGTIPAIIGEYGNSTSSSDPLDAGGTQAIQAVFNAVALNFGSTAYVLDDPANWGDWNNLYANTPPTLSTYGTSVQTFITAGPGP